MTWIESNNNVLVLQVGQKMPDEVREAMEARVEAKTGHACVILDMGVVLAGEVPPGSCAENRRAPGHRRPTSKHTKS